jgi:hypothetical protein
MKHFKPNELLALKWQIGSHNRERSVFHNDVLPKPWLAACN